MISVPAVLLSVPAAFVLSGAVVGVFVAPFASVGSGSGVSVGVGVSVTLTVGVASGIDSASAFSACIPPNVSIRPFSLPVARRTATTAVMQIAKIRMPARILKTTSPASLLAEYL